MPQTLGIFSGGAQMTRYCIAVGAIGIALVTAASWAQAPRTNSPQGAKVYFVSPKNGEVVKGPVRIVMGLSGMGVAPAGADFPDTGHHHILVNVDQPAALDSPMPVDERTRHFGKG